MSTAPPAEAPAVDVPAIAPTHGLLPARPTIGRLERYVALCYQIQQESTYAAPPPERNPRRKPAEPGSLAEIAEEIEARTLASRPPVLVLDPEALINALFLSRHYRAVLACVFVHADGTDATEEEADALEPEEVGHALVPFWQGVLTASTQLSGGASGGVFGGPTIPPPTTGSTTPSGTSPPTSPGS